MATEQLTQMLLQGTWDTLYVTVVSTLLAYIIGIPLGVLLYGTTQGSLFPNKGVNTVVGVVVNVLRSIPFIILLILTRQSGVHCVPRDCGGAVCGAHD